MFHSVLPRSSPLAIKMNFIKLDLDYVDTIEVDIAMRSSMEIFIKDRRKISKCFRIVRTKRCGGILN